MGLCWPFTVAPNSASSVASRQDALFSFHLHEMSSSLFLLLLVAKAQERKCEYPRLLSALKANYGDGTGAFCNQLLASISTMGTLREDPAVVFYTTVTDTKSTDTVYKSASTTIKKRITLSSYESQKRTPSTLVQPLPRKWSQNDDSSLFLSSMVTYTLLSKTRRSTIIIGNPSLTPQPLPSHSAHPPPTIPSRPPAIY